MQNLRIAQNTVLIFSSTMDFIGDIDLMGLLSVIIFYFLILGVGMWAAQKKSNVEGVSEEVGGFSIFIFVCLYDILFFFHKTISTKLIYLYLFLYFLHFFSVFSFSFHSLPWKNFHLYSILYFTFRVHVKKTCIINGRFR